MINHKREIAAANWQRSAWARISVTVVFGILLHLPSTTARASSHFTPKQLEIFRVYVGKTYWVVDEEGRIPSFLSAPSPSSPSFRPGLKESFQIKEIVGGTPQTPFYYYKTVFDSGKEGYISVGSFLEELSLTFVTSDPDRDIKRKLAKEAQEESKRQAWIRAQSWSQHVKEAALKKQPVLGMSSREARAILGRPKRVVALKSANPLMGKQEQWIYESGPVLTFTNGLVTRIQPLESGKE